MAAPPCITDWLRRTYPRPQVDPEWLDACLTWISGELHLNDINTQVDEIISNVDSQLLNSDLRDSMLVGTGLPPDVATAEKMSLRGNILVQIQGITEIGHSAFSLQNVQQMRIDRADLAGLAGDDGDEDEGPIPNYPRSMLRFDLTDGSKMIKAIEYRQLPELQLGVTPLGYKMVLKDVPIRRGIAFLEPSNVLLKGYMAEELDTNREADFARGLRMRLGQPEPELEPGEELPQPPPQPPEVPPAVQHRENEPQRAPLRDVSGDDRIPCRPPRHPTREELEPPTRRRVPAGSSAPTSTTVVSPYFSDTTSSSTTVMGSSHLTSLRLSPIHQGPLPANTLASRTTAGEDSLSFSDDDMHIDDTFLQELEAAEQAALDTIQRRDRNAGQITLSPTHATPVMVNSEVILIDSDEEDKENLAPVVQRRVRRRLAASDSDSDVIVIE